MVIVCFVIADNSSFMSWKPYGMMDHEIIFNVLYTLQKDFQNQLNDS